MKSPTHDWEGRFTERFLETGDTIATVAGYVEEIFDFIRTEIEAAEKRGEARERERITWRVEGIKITTGSAEAKIGGDLIKKVVLNAIKDVLIAPTNTV